MTDLVTPAELPAWHTMAAADAAPVTRPRVQAWLDDYVAAWRADDEVAIAALWAPTAVWHYPFEVRARGRAAITAEWTREGDEYPDEVFEAHYEPIAIDGTVVVAHGRTVFLSPDRSTVEAAFDNVWVLRFDAEGRCLEFHEWYAGRPEDEPDRAVPHPSR